MSQSVSSAAVMIGDLRVTLWLKIKANFRSQHRKNNILLRFSEEKSMVIILLQNYFEWNASWSVSPHLHNTYYVLWKSDNHRGRKEYPFTLYLNAYVYQNWSQ